MTYTQRQRSSLAYQLRYAVKNPTKIGPYLSRYARDTMLRAGSADHVAYYREVMRSDVKEKSPYDAVGSRSHDHWLKNGKRQFDYLVTHGLRPHHNVLEIGCGNLRAGWRIIDLVGPGNYHGIDISPDILLAANDTIVQYGLQDKLPHLMLVGDLTFSGLPDARFDVINAHSVFSHTPLEVIEECFSHIGRILRPTGFFDLTFDRTERAEHQVLREDFYYRTETLQELAAAYGLAATFMDDWEATPHKQSKLRICQS
ncbi:class I SAM-dependent methyltransferase [Actinocorallia longicatena]|uniref:Class I SAM-dependent methyltransferase n=1 Tax=Actinocorallia longicatena TaxID=111803 RepID=A0ABP6Q0K0_9ACTN